MFPGETMFICCCLWAFSLFELFTFSSSLLLLLMPVLMMDLLLLLLTLLLRRDCMFSAVCHPNTFCDRRSGDDVLIVGPGDACNECRLFRNKFGCCCSCCDGLCHPNTFSLWCRMFLALTPLNSKSIRKRGKNRALRVIKAIPSPRRRRDGRSSINALLCSLESLLLLACVVFMLAAPVAVVFGRLVLLLPKVFFWNFGFHFNVATSTVKHFKWMDIVCRRIGLESIHTIINRLLSWDSSMTGVTAV